MAAKPDRRVVTRSLTAEEIATLDAHLPKWVAANKIRLQGGPDTGRSQFVAEAVREKLARESKK